MKDIVFVLDNGLGGGGAERVASNLISFWASEGRKVTLVSMRGSEGDFYSVPAAVERVVLGGASRSANKLSALVANLRRLAALRRFFRGHQAPVIISFLTVTNIRTVIASLGLGKKVIISERIDTSRESQFWFWLMLRRLLYRHATLVTANSRVALDDMAKYVPASKLAFIPNPVCLPASAAEPERSAGILCVGRLALQKNHALLLEALALLLTQGGGTRGGDWTAEILGQGPEEKALGRLIGSLGLEGRVRLRGAVPDPSPHYQAAALFVLPSLFEGTPNALLEAMAHGLPCIVSDSLPGALAHVEDGVSGLVFRSGDAAHLAQQLALLLEDPSLRRRLGAAARRRMEAFSPERVVPLWDGLGAPCAA